MFLKFIIFAIMATAFVAAAQMGGWSAADPKSPEVLDAAKFAVNNKFDGQHLEFKVAEARKQVVAGMSYDLVVEAWRPGMKCTVLHFRVWNRFGTFSLTESEIMKEACSA